jgi:hypothetical protein
VNDRQVPHSDHGAEIYKLTYEEKKNAHIRQKSSQFCFVYRQELRFQDGALEVSDYEMGIGSGESREITCLTEGNTLTRNAEDVTRKWQHEQQIIHANL